MPMIDDVFLSRVGHDLRGELATMVAGVHYLIRYEGGTSATAKQMLERVDGAGQRMRRLLDEFDNAAWITGGDPSQLIRSRQNLADVVAAVLDRLAPQLVLREVSVDNRLPPSMPTFETDGELLGIALEYVIDFAVARSVGKRVLLSRSGSVDAPGSGVRVEDQGGPLADASLAARVFEPFVEKDLVPKLVTGGSKRRERLGLGLAIARGILTALGGSIAVEPGDSGLVFVCAMPP
jgi:two-component system, OmpR family, sensor kinase